MEDQQVELPAELEELREFLNKIEIENKHLQTLLNNQEAERIRIEVIKDRLLFLVSDIYKDGLSGDAKWLLRKALVENIKEL